MGDSGLGAEMSAEEPSIRSDDRRELVNLWAPARSGELADVACRQMMDEVRR